MKRRAPIGNEVASDELRDWRNQHYAREVTIDRALGEPVLTAIETLIETSKIGVELASAHDSRVWRYDRAFEVLLGRLPPSILRTHVLITGEEAIKEQGWQRPDCRYDVEIKYGTAAGDSLYNVFYALTSSEYGTELSVNDGALALLGAATLLKELEYKPKQLHEPHNLATPYEATRLLETLVDLQQLQIAADQNL